MWDVIRTSNTYIKFWAPYVCAGRRVQRGQEGQGHRSQPRPAPSLPSEVLTLSLPHSLTLTLSLPHSLTPSLPHSQTPSLPHSGGSRTPNRESRNTQSEPQNPESRNQKPEIRNTINEARNRRCPCLRTYPKLEPRNPCLRSENRKPKSAPMSLASDVSEPRNPKPETLNPKC